MAAKKKIAKKKPSRKSSTKRPAKNKVVARKPVSKKASKKSTAQKKVTTKKKVAAGKKKTATKTATSSRTGEKSFSVGRAAARRGLGLDSGGQAGDLQGLPQRTGPDSESVEELLEEGNTLEAGVVAGVEEADDADEREVHTHEVPEDDVPDEYLDRDS